MDKIFEDLNAVRIGVKSWVSHAEKMVSGAPLEEGQSPVLPTDCVFGQWYYKSGRALKDFPAYERLEIPHDNQHILYLRIFNLLFDESDVSTFGKFLGHNKAMKEERKEEAKELLPHLRGLNQQILELLDLLEEQIKASQMSASERLKSLSPSSEQGKKGKYNEVNKMLESLEIKINKSLD